MSASNFTDMKDFPLIVMWESDEERADAEWAVGEMERIAERLNEESDFFRVSVKPGYFEGYQFLVKEVYCNVLDWDDADADAEFSTTAAHVKEDYLREKKRIRKELLRAKDELFLFELKVEARFSNGDTWYRTA